MDFKGKTKKWISPTICLTHKCNLSCIYCYETTKNGASDLKLSDGIKIICDLLENTSKDTYGIEFCFIGGEPLLKFDLIKQLVEYFENYPTERKFIFSATTNGTLLTEPMKEWFSMHREKVILCLSLDGNKETHDKNRTFSFDKIDFAFFVQNYPYQGIKMTLSEHSLYNLFENVTFIHDLGFNKINGANLYEGDYNWDSENYLYMLGRELKKLLEYYSDKKNEKLSNQMFMLPIGNCEEAKRRKMKNCGIGEHGSLFFDVDGKKYPCVMCTSMTLSESHLEYINNLDFTDNSLFVDFSCNESCYIYPVCTNCSGSNLINNGNFSFRDKTKCNIKKLVALFNAEILARKIVVNPSNYSEYELEKNINAICKIKDLYYSEYEKYFQ